MALSEAALAALIATCAPSVHLTTMAAVVRVESSGDPFALNVNKARRQPPPASSAAEAARVARWYISKGYSVDLGLGQVNNRNLGWLGLSIEEALDPCTNLAAGARILTDAYRRVSQGQPDAQAALKAALSAYNTGSPVKGFLNGYVAKYYPDGTSKTAETATLSYPMPATTDDVGSAYAGTILAIMGDIDDK